MNGPIKRRSVSRSATTKSANELVSASVRRPNFWTQQWSKQAHQFQPVSSGRTRPAPRSRRRVECSPRLGIARTFCETNQSTSHYPLAVGYRHLRETLAAFIIGDPAPEPLLPEPSELNRLAFPEHRNLGLDGISGWLVDNRVSG
jgi:hypothetical protein